MQDHPDSNMHQLVGDAYKATLARNHSWFVRKTANLAFYAIPSREKLIGRMTENITHDEVRVHIYRP